MNDNWLDHIKWTTDGLVPAIAQDAASGRVLMMAWMNRESLRHTVECGEAVYWSRSRQQLWHKGESSGHTQKVKHIRLDCDADVLLLEIEQIGGIACHTGRQSCFFEELREGQWVAVDPVIKDPHEMRMEEADWDIVIDVNLKGAFNCSKAVVRSMMKQRYGRIVNISSVSGQAGQTGQANYSASKAGLIGLTKALARELASRQITVNAVAPGFVLTALTQDLSAELKDAIVKATPLGRMGTPEEIAYAVAFLASDDASYITGQVLAVDGGMVMM